MAKCFYQLLCAVEATFRVEIMCKWLCCQHYVFKGADDWLRESPLPYHETFYDKQDGFAFWEGDPAVQPRCPGAGRAARTSGGRSWRAGGGCSSGAPA